MRPRIGYVDTETVSDFDIKKVGTIRYAEECDALCVTVIPPGMRECILWEAHKGPMPSEMHEMFSDSGITWCAHNAMFDRTVLVNALGLLGLVDPARWICTAALSRYLGFPGRLSDAAKRAGVADDLLKMDDSGGIHMFTKRYSKRFFTPRQAPDEWAAFMAYAVQDTYACKALHQRLTQVMPPEAAAHWEAHEHDVFLWDQAINHKGMRVDRDVLEAASSTIELFKPRLAKQMEVLTRGEIRNVGSQKLKDYLNSEYKMQVPDLQRGTLDDILADPFEMLDPEAREIIELRLDGNRPSLAKYERMGQMASGYDHRVRAGFMYAGAHTKRWSGQGFQPQNLTRPAEGLDPEEIAQQMVARKGTPFMLINLYKESPFEVLSSGIRGAIVPAPGHLFVIGDYNQIESRVMAWGSNCQRKLQAFSDYDNGLSEYDPYEVTALDVLGDASKRQQGKMLDLGLGFGMGASKFCTINKLDPEDGAQMHRLWRETYVDVPILWDALTSLFYEALGRKAYSQFDTTDQVKWLRRHGVDVVRDENRICTLTLPSGQPILYHGLRNATWGECMASADKFGRLPETEARFARVNNMEYEPRRDAKRFNRGQLGYRGPFGSIRFVHGGLFAENFAQGTSREVMAYDGVTLWEEHGLVPVLTSHDEMVFEVPADQADAAADIVRKQMSRPVDWLPGMPIEAEVKIHERYTK